MKGFIKLHRDIVNSDIYQMPPLYLRVFERLLLEANHEDAYIPYREKSTNITGKKLIKRGERLTSIRHISEWVGWYERGIFKVPNPKTITTILDWLTQNNMIQIYNQGNRQETHYNIVNYCVYQDNTSDESNTQVTEKKQSTDINKNDKNVKNDKNLKDIMLFKEIINYLNEKTGSSYKHNTNKNIELMKARLKEGFTLEDFKKVIDNKVRDWGKEPKQNEKDMREYLRPITLFGTKFESYLNQKGGNTNGTTVGTNNAKIFKFDKTKLLANFADI